MIWKKFVWVLKTAGYGLGITDCQKIHFSAYIFPYKWKTDNDKKLSWQVLHSRNCTSEKEVYVRPQVLVVYRSQYNIWLWSVLQHPFFTLVFAVVFEGSRTNNFLEQWCFFFHAKGLQNRDFISGRFLDSMPILFFGGHKNDTC